MSSTRTESPTRSSRNANTNSEGIMLDESSTHCVSGFIIARSCCSVVSRSICTPMNLLAQSPVIGKKYGFYLGCLAVTAKWRLQVMNGGFTLMRRKWSGKAIWMCIREGVRRGRPVNCIPVIEQSDARRVHVDLRNLLQCSHCSCTISNRRMCIHESVVSSARKELDKARFNDDE